MPPAWRNQRTATGVDTPISSAASSVRLPCAISRQKARSTCHAGIGRPGERIAGRRARSAPVDPDPPGVGLDELELCGGAAGELEVADGVLLTPCHRTPPRSGEVL